MNEEDNIKQQAQQLETQIENNPTEAASELPQDTPIQEEAVQAVDGGKDAEVNNKIAEDFIKKAGLLGGKPVESKLSKKEQLEIGRKELQDIEDDQWMNNDFGIEYKPTKEEKAALAEHNRHLHRQNIDDMLNQTFEQTGGDIEAQAEEIVNSAEQNPEETVNSGEQSEEAKVEKEAEEIVEEDEEAKKEETTNSQSSIVIPRQNIGGVSNSSSSTPTDIDRTRTVGGSFGRAFNHPNINGSVSTGSQGSVNTSAKSNSSRIAATGSMKPIEEAKNVSPAVKPNATAGNRTSNGGTFGSGSVNKSGGSLIAKSPKLAGGESNNQADLADEDALRQGTVKQLMKRILQLDPHTREALGFSKDGSKYNEQPIDKADGEVLSRIDEVLSAVGN